MPSIYFATPFRTTFVGNPNYEGFNGIDQLSNLFTPLRGVVIGEAVDTARNMLVEDFLRNTENDPDSWLFFIDDDVLLPTDTLDLWLLAKKKNPDGRVFYGEYARKKRTYQSASVIAEDGKALTIATGCMFIHRSVFTELRTKRLTAFNVQYDGRWFVCMADKPNTGEDTYFTALLNIAEIPAYQVTGLDCPHIDFERKIAYGHSSIAANGKILKSEAWAYAIEASSPLYKHIIEQ